MAENKSFWQKHVSGKDGLFGRLGQNSVGETLKQNFAWQGNKLAFAGRSVAVAVGATMAYKAIANDRTEEGEERSGLARLTQGIVGAGLAVGGALVGKGK